MIRRGAEGEYGGGGLGVGGGGGTGVEGDNEPTPPPDLARWSSHRVMQWLKEIDLAEYAPNLRGAGEILFFGISYQVFYREIKNYYY